MRRLSAQLAGGFAVIALVTIALISLTANVLIKRQFESSVAAQQQNLAAQMAEALAPQYNAASGSWNLDYVHGYGMYALKDGYIIKLYASDGTVLWDAENHDMSQCHQIMQSISAQMRRLELEGRFLSHRYELRQQGQLVGHLAVSYYSPYYLNEYDFRFLASLNKILLLVGLAALLLAAAAGAFWARRLSAPISKTVAVIQEIAAGRYGIRFETPAEALRTQELAELSCAVNHMAASLEKQEALRRRLTVDVAHELRTPVSNVASQLEALLEGVWEPTRERLQGCYAELQRIAALAEDLESLRQSESSRLQLRKEPVDLLALAQAAVQAFEPELARKELSCTVQGISVFVLGESGRLQQVLANLLSNAVKYSYAGGRITISIGEEGEQARMTVCDQGIGIAEEELPLVFERFYRTDRSRSRRTGGAGIGLTIAKAIVEAHGGSITASAAAGGGSCFAVILPKR